MSVKIWCTDGLPVLSISSGVKLLSIGCVFIRGSVSTSVLFSFSADVSLGNVSGSDGVLLSACSFFVDVSFGDVSGFKGVFIHNYRFSIHYFGIVMSPKTDSRYNDKIGVPTYISNVSLIQKFTINTLIRGIRVIGGIRDTDKNNAYRRNLWNPRYRQIN